jgi:uncharacterized protein (DUF1499 family)
MLKILGTIAIIVFLGVPALAMIAGQLNLLSGRRPADTGVREGKLRPPVSDTWNSVSSQAALHPHTDYHVIAPLKFTGDAKAAFARLAAVVRAMDGATVVEETPDYLHAEYRTRMLRFVDDVEFLLDAPAGVIHMRSASRLGRKDFGANRARLEAVRARFDAASPAAQLGQAR